MVATLGFERVALAETTGLLRRALDDLVHYAKETRRDGQPLAHDPLWRQRLAGMAVEIEAQRMLSYRTWWLASKGVVPQYEASAAKVYGDELTQRFANLAMQLLGLYGQLDKGSKSAPFEGRICRDYLGSVATSIAGGTPEIQKNIIAMRGLGLPRSY